MLSQFIIHNLFGQYAFEIEVKEDKLILVAENGSGKTTILRLLFFFLSGQWDKLLNWYQSSMKEVDHEQENGPENLPLFSLLEAIIDGKKYQFDPKKFRNQYVHGKGDVQSVINKYPLYKEVIKEILTQYEDINELKVKPRLIEQLSTRFDVPPSLLLGIIKQISDQKDEQIDYPKLDINILYLPTYRRIEREFKAVFPDLEDSLAQSLKDIIPELSEKISEEKEGSENARSATEENLHILLEDLWEEMRTNRWEEQQQEKKNFRELVEFGMSDVEYHIAQALKQHKANFTEEWEERLQQFVQVCNKYLGTGKRKQLIYEENRLTLRQLKPEERDIDFASLSSGEKQIIALFSHLYFSERPNLLIIDEPELSLSIYWQKQLIEDILRANCAGLIAATHSPFIIPDHMKPFTSGLEEFRKTE